MLLDEDVEYDADELDRAVEPVDPDDPWEESSGRDGGDVDEGGDGSGSDENPGDDGTGSLTDVAE